LRPGRTFITPPAGPNPCPHTPEKNGRFSNCPCSR
jgi:hypothetical protein